MPESYTAADSGLVRDALGRVVDTVQQVAARFLTGTGSPEGVVAAPVGTVYSDTAVTAGAIEWTKWSGTGNTGWRVTKGDTGWVTLPASSFGENCSPYSGGVRLRRTSTGIFMTAEVSTTAEFVTGSTAFTVPAWATPNGGAWAPHDGYAGQPWWWSGASVKFGGAGASPARRTGTHFYPTDAAWPTTLTI